MFLAHRTEEGREQCLIDHLTGTARLAALFGTVFGQEALAQLLGLAHDIGKYSWRFQRRIRGENISVDHSTAGGYELSKLAMPVSAVYCIMGHHGGLPDGGSRSDSAETGTLLGRMARMKKEHSKEEDYSAFQKEVELKEAVFTSPHLLGKGGFTVAYWTRMLYSCLVDADFLDTEAFMYNGAIQRRQNISIDMLCEKLEKYIKDWWDSDELINQKRCEILRQCINAGKRDEKGFFTLTVPTGGGKTVSSLAFALHHAKAQNMHRVIYVIPYCSIIEQTVEEFEKILGKEAVLAHYAEADFEDDPVKKLAAENWDMPIIVTTAVQFFESLFSNKPSRCRKLHNIANSVIIFDETQTLPRPYLKPCVRAMAELTVNYSVSCVLCTATQPALMPILKEIIPQSTCREIAADTKGLYEFFRRVTFLHAGKLTDEVLAARLSNEKQVLCIVGTRKQAQSVFAKLTGEGCFHLSTLLYPAHRRAILQRIRDRLKNGQVCRVVATSLIEAGVDVDFCTVYRAEAGLDSIIQAAGRCNRENKRSREDSMVYLFEPEERYQKHLPHSLRRPLQTAKGILHTYSEIDAPEAIEAYFTELYRVSGAELDANEIIPAFEEVQNGLYPFATVAKKFQLIGDDSRMVLIPKEKEAQKLAKRLREGECSRAWLREAGEYCVNVYTKHFETLYNQYKLEIPDKAREGVAILRDITCYSQETGLSLLPDSGAALFDCM